MDVVKLIIGKYQVIIRWRRENSFCMESYVGKFLNDIILKGHIICRNNDTSSCFDVHTCITISTDQRIVTTDLESIQLYIIRGYGYKWRTIPFSRHIQIQFSWRYDDCF